jgi:hypothetical protein
LFHGKKWLEVTIYQVYAKTNEAAKKNKVQVQHSTCNANNMPTP